MQQLLRHRFGSGIIRELQISLGSLKMLASRKGHGIRKTVGARKSVSGCSYKNNAGVTNSVEVRKNVVLEKFYLSSLSIFCDGPLKTSYYKVSILLCVKRTAVQISIQR